MKAIVQVGYGSPGELALREVEMPRVEAVGEDVTGFRPGDEVFGGTNGSFAEYT